MNSNPELMDELRASRNRLSMTILFGTVIALASFGYFSLYCSDSLFAGDAADYVRGAKIGLTASYFDTRSVGLWGSIRVMKQHPDARLHLWMRRLTDISMWRRAYMEPPLPRNSARLGELIA